MPVSDKNLFVVEVIPLVVLPPNVPQILSYYHNRRLVKGAVVEISIQNRKAEAVVIGSHPVEYQKINLKKSSFQLKKIGAVISEVPLVSEAQFKTALWLANTYASPLGLALKTVLPPFFLKKKYPVSIRLNAVSDERHKKPEWLVCRAKEAAKHILKRIEQVKGQVLIMVPEVAYIRHFAEKIPQARILHSQISNQDAHAIWTEAAETAPLIVIGTRQALFLPFSKLQLLVVIDPLHEFYKSDLSPKYRAPELAEMIAGLHGAQPLFVSNTLGVAAYHARNLGQLAEYRDLIKPWRISVNVVDMIAEIKQHFVNLFAAEVRKRLYHAVHERKRILVVSARRGYAGILLCERCGHSFKCPNCDVPMRIHQAIELVLLCHRCDISRSYPKFCANCHSSQIKPTGPAGSQKIYEVLRKMMEYGELPTAKMLILDSDVVKNETEEQEVIDALNKPLEPGAIPTAVILIATQKIFSYIFEERFDYIVIPQFDALTIGTDFQTSEHLWHQLEKLADFEPELIDAQTYHHKEILPTVAEHRYDKLYGDELQLREAFKYPPYSHLVKLSFSHTQSGRAVAECRGLVEKLKMAAIHLQMRDRIHISESSPAFIRKEKGLYVATIVLKIIPSIEPVPSLDGNFLRTILRFVPSSWMIDVNPRTTL